MNILRSTYDGLMRYIEGKNKLIIVLWIMLLICRVYERSGEVPICNVYNIYTSCPDSVSVNSDSTACLY